ncbi:hypothetical protein PLICRDRAFT_53894 [Plicaturopsis crispa FD-325 SS-3]|nr:hypothetical protein PLICRDRAFT_53894 [Plicaturopsis crispa FD-325 SS-3]
MARQLSSHHDSAKGKRPKTFLDEKGALELAASIAGIQESKAASKSEKHHQAQIGQPRHPRKSKPRASASRDKLNDTKAMISAQRARLKKNKAKQKSQKPGAAADVQGGPSLPQKPRKTVSFA